MISGSWCLPNTKMYVLPADVHQEREASSRIIRFLAHEAEPMRLIIGSPFVIRATISKALLAVHVKRTVQSVVGPTPNSIGQSRFPAQFSASSTNMQTSIS